MQLNHDLATTPAGPSRFPLFVPGLPRGVLSFDILPPLGMRLTFLPRPPPARPGKRSRAAADIDGEHSCLQKKKRRLRLFLITSRLSPQFSHPATNIVDRGSSKIAVWAKQKALGRNLLRKAAILNRIRRQTVATRSRDDEYARSPAGQEKEQEQLQMAKLEFDHGSIDTYTRPVHSTTHSVPPTAAVRTGDHFVVSGSPSSSPSSSRSPSPTSSSSPPLKAIREDTPPTYRSPNAAYAYSPPRAQIPRRDYSPLPPSPLGLSNYDAFDGDEGGSDPYSRFDDDDEHVHIPYDDDDDDVPFSPSAVTITSVTTAATSTNEAVQTPPPLYTDFQLLDPGESVFTEYEQVKEGADAVWPSTLSMSVSEPQQTSTLSPGSTSPNFPAVVATATATAASSKRTDSFAMSPNLRPLIPAPISRPSSTSANFAAAAELVRSPSGSQNFTASRMNTSIPMSPNFLPSPAASTPRSTALDTVPPKRNHGAQTGEASKDQLERRRQRDYMFMKF
ncbi:hypothetical protein T440DRAFT_177414 [Plenodomus tracheiphilus IPT5]|uniref:Uncharacterized protein n=1 Tax=Plenodomus tracheiphilus IPT5 TaxID=1408161 RepID=A0A6A7AY00_9PLEO|nr:hypothetical protein T440DRAFT_177414 [Plenodomus tracheiphilus IPT5]